jgi:hypothetical protein
MKKQVYQSVQTAVPNATRRAMPVLAILFVMMFAFVSSSFAQDKVAVSAIQKDTSKTVWHTLKTIGSVTISYQYVDCGPVEYVQFKIDNASTDKVAVSWTFKQFNGTTEKEVNADMAKVSYTVNASSNVAGACFSEHIKLGVFVRESGMVPMVTDIELTDINVSIAQ